MRDSHVIGRNSEKMTKDLPPRRVCEPPNQVEQAQFLGSNGGNPGYLDQLMKNDSQKRPLQVKTKIEPRIAVCEPPPRANQIKVEEDPMAGFLGSMGGNPGYLAQLTK